MNSIRETQRLINQLLQEGMNVDHEVAALKKVFGIDKEDFMTRQNGEHTRVAIKFSRTMSHTPTKDNMDALGILIRMVVMANVSGMDAKVEIFFSNFPKASPKSGKMHKSITNIKAVSAEDLFEKVLKIVEKEAGEAPFENRYMETFYTAILKVLNNRKSGTNLSESYGLTKPTDLTMFLQD